MDKNEKYIKIETAAKDLNLGATGEFSDGKLNDEDEGEIKLGITTDQTDVIIIFGKKISWIGMPPDLAIQLGNTLISRANEIKAKEENVT